MMRLMKVPDQTSIPGLRKMELKDCTQACKLLTDYLKVKYHDIGGPTLEWLALGHIFGHQMGHSNVGAINIRGKRCFYRV